jgi:P4 family phage/plasmid primase-like protien
MTAPAQDTGAGAQPFGTGAAAYLGWTGIIPVHRRTKVPFQGFTGRDGAQVSYEQSAGAASDRKYASCNLALRLDLGYIGIDVDDYDDKPGGRTLAALEAQLGALPATVKSTARMPEDQVSGIRIFRVPADLEFDGIAGPGIEIVQHHHRFAMAWPSVHPKTGRVYRWYGPENELLDTPPLPSAIPALPDAWTSHLAVSSTGERTVGDGTAAAEFLAEFTGTDALRMFDQVSDRFRAMVTAGKARHDSMLKALGQAMREAARGYYPAAVAEERLRDLWNGATAGEDRDREYASLLERATADVNVQAEQLKRLVAEETGSAPAGGQGDNRFTDAFMAQTVADDVLSGRHCWAPGTGWLAWSGVYWARCDEGCAVEAVRMYVVGQVEASARQVRELRDGAAADLTGWTKILSAGRLRAITGLARAIVAVPDAALDADPDLLNCPNGIVDLRNGALLDHRADQYMTRVCGVAYDPTANAPEWDAVLSAMPPETAVWMRERVGQAATGHRVPDDRVPLLQGTGSNGKTTFTAAVAGALGSYHVLVPDGLLLGKAQRDESMTLRGARFALMEETPQGAFLNSVMLKKATSPEMTGHHLYASETVWTTTHSLFVTTNYRPVVSETDDGTWRRLALVTFPYRFTRGVPNTEEGERQGDPLLRARIEQGDPEILRTALKWVVDGARQWYRDKGVMSALPQRVVDDTRTWRFETDLVLSYVTENLEFDLRGHVRSSDLLLDFNDWLMSMGNKGWSDRTFAQQFGSHDEVARHKVDKRHTRKGPGLSELGMFDRHGGQFPRQNAASYKAWFGVAFRKIENTENQDHVSAVSGETKLSEIRPYEATLPGPETAETLQVNGTDLDPQLFSSNGRGPTPGLTYPGVNPAPVPFGSDLPPNPWGDLGTGPAKGSAKGTDDDEWGVFD